MHLKQHLPFVAAALLLLSSCGTEGDPNDFTKVTQRDANAVPIGEADPTDWMLAEEWSAKEKKLFAKYAFYKHKTVANAPSGVIGYPNPATSILTVHNDMAGAKLDIRFVDKKFHVLSKTDQVDMVSVSFNMHHLAGASEYVRMYYMLIRNDSCVGKGHGDIRLK